MLDQVGKRTPLIAQTLYVEGHDPVSNVAVDVALTYNSDFKEHIFLMLTISTLLKAVHT